jgi:hypothetical protein
VATRRQLSVRHGVFYPGRVEFIKGSGFVNSWSLPCGGGVEYLHRDPASRRRRRKGKSQIWDSKIRSQVPRDSGPRMTALARPAAYTKDRPVLSSERAPHKKQDRNCQTVINIWSWAPHGARHQDLLTDWPSVAMWLRLRIRGVEMRDWPDVV